METVGDIVQNASITTLDYICLQKGRWRGYGRGHIPRGPKQLLNGTCLKVCMYFWSVDLLKVVAFGGVLPHSITNRRRQL